MHIVLQRPSDFRNICHLVTQRALVLRHPHQREHTLNHRYRVFSISMLKSIMGGVGKESKYSVIILTVYLQGMH